MNPPADEGATPVARQRRVPVEAWCVGAFAVIGFWLIVDPRITWAAIDTQIYHKLAAAFTSGFVVSFSVAYLHLLFRHVTANARRACRSVAFFGALILAVAAFTLVKSPHLALISRLTEAAALGAGGMALGFTLFLPVAGLVSGGAFGGVLRELARVWWAFIAYSLFGGFCVTAIRVWSPQVWDPVLLRMDLSLGFPLTEAAYHLHYLAPWVYTLSDFTYPLLGLMIAGVAARLHIAGAIAETRRHLFAAFIVGVLGLACYAAFPAIGPIYAYRPLFALLDTPASQAAAEAVRAAALSGPDQIYGKSDILRNVMPSLHVAFTLVTLAAAWSWRRRFFWLCLPVGFFQITTTLTLGVHYLVDLFAAVPLAALSWWIADRGIRLTPHRVDRPLPALALQGPALAAGNRRVWAAVTLATFLLIAWGALAPIPPWIAWPLAVVIVGAPAWTSLRVNRHLRSAEPPLVSIPRNTPPIDRRVRLLTAAVFCSGGIALVLEQIYEKYLSTLVGSSRSAATIVLAVYFAGLALGAWLCPKQSAGAPRRLAALEIFIAAWAVLVGVGFFAVDRVLGGWLAHAGGSALSLAAIRTAIAVLWILPPTLAMGAQLPTLAAVLAGHPVWRGRTITHFYAVNLAGAFAFTLLTPPLLFNTVGADGALWSIAVLGLVVGLALWFSLPGTEAPLSPASRARPLLAPFQPFSLSVFQPLIWAFAAGFGFFALEVIWFHLISAVCSASAYSFSILLAVVLLGLALGGHLAARRPTPLAPVLGWLVVALALGSALWPWAGPLMARVAGTQQLEAFWAGEFLKLCVVALVVLPSATLAGQVFPRLLRDGEPAGGSRAVGALCAANVVGCIAGALGAGFGLIPLFGAERALQGLVLLAAAGWLALVVRGPRRLGWIVPGAAGLFLLIALPPWNRLQLTGGFGVYLQAPGWVRDGRLTFFREDFATGFVTVVERERRDRATPVRTLLQNGKFDADDDREMPAQVGFGLVAALHAPATHRALVIGCGSGQTLSVIARLGFEHVDLVELSPAHLAAARAEFSAINAGVLDRANVRVHLEDGRNHLLRSRERYDAIQIELTSVWFAGATNLYSREFYALARARLNPGGVLVQWVQLHHLSSREIAAILATAQAEFPAVSVWRVGQQACLLASDRPPVFNPTVWEKWRNAPDLLDERLITGLMTPAAFAATQLVPADRLPVLLARTPVAINTDRNRWLEFQTPKYALDRRDLRAANLRWLASSRSR